MNPHKTIFKFFIGIVLIFIFFACTRDASRVKEVIDGDTIVMGNGMVVRYAGIDTPELGYQGTPAENFAGKAENRNAALVLGKKVKVVPAQTPEDSRGRTLACVYLEDGRIVNEVLLEEGLAHVYFHQDNPGNFKRFLSVQQKAMKKGKGLWSAIRQRKEGPFIGNRNSLRFHSPHCRYGMKTSPKNRVHIRTLEEAFYNGYSPCRNCLYNIP